MGIQSRVMQVAVGAGLADPAFYAECIEESFEELRAATKKAKKKR